MGDLSDGEYDPAAVYKARLINLANKADAQFNVSERLETGKKYAMEHPIITIAGVVTLLMCSLPIMMFGAFVLATFFCTFMGFLFVEGFLLTIGGALLGAVLLATGIISLFLSMVLASAWLLFHYGNSIVQKAGDIINGRMRGSGVLECSDFDNEEETSEDHNKINLENPEKYHEEKNKF